MSAQLGVAVIGCGLMGARRAATAAAHPRTRVVAVVDSDAERAQKLAGSFGVRSGTDWRREIDRQDVDIVAVCTPNGLLAEIGTAALASGKHVLLEKPMGRSLAEARDLAGAAEASGRTLKIGFNHRYHPALEAARRITAEGEIGRLVHVRARYGHGGRPGCEAEWRGRAELAGGGELMDQGVHLTDLIHWFAGVPSQAVAFVQTAVWPVQPLEDNAYGMFRFADGTVAQLHASMTQWKNLFSFEVFGDRGSVTVEGLGGSYGAERLVHAERNLAGGAPVIHAEEFPGDDVSWEREWSDFVAAIDEGELRQGGVADGLAAMRMVDALYRSASTGGIVEV